jgi:hypothetical protein
MAYPPSTKFFSPDFHANFEDPDIVLVARKPKSSKWLDDLSLEFGTFKRSSELQITKDHWVHVMPRIEEAGFTVVVNLEDEDMLT